MDAKGAKEAAPLMQRALGNLLRVVPVQGRAGSDLRTACGALSANAEVLLRADATGPPLAKCFDLARTAGATQPQLAIVRNATIAETPRQLGAVITKGAIVNLCLASEGRVISTMTFTSRADVSALQADINRVFAVWEEDAADAMDQMTYQALVGLQAAIIAFLVETARPLPRMVSFQFAAVTPTLVTAMRLYADAGRADELRDENKVVHPAFMPPTGRGLSA
jgi:prophage DNA circulation protein